MGRVLAQHAHGPEFGPHPCIKWALVTRVCKPSTQEVEEEKQKFEASLCYTENSKQDRVCFKIK